MCLSPNKSVHFSKSVTKMTDITLLATSKNLAKLFSLTDLLSIASYQQVNEVSIALFLEQTTFL